MTLGDRLKEQRKKSGLSQEKAAEIIGVSRQAVTKWEANQSAPSSESLMALASLYHISLDELTENIIKGKKGPNMILRSNLTWLAIAFQASILSLCMQVFRNTLMNNATTDKNFWWISLGILLLCSVWMATNLMYEKDRKQRMVNIRIELLYCSIQVVIALLSFYLDFLFWGTVLIMTIVLIYIFLINPKYMNRAFLKKDHPDNE